VHFDLDTNTAKDTANGRPIWKGVKILIIVLVSFSLEHFEGLEIANAHTQRFPVIVALEDVAFGTGVVPKRIYIDLFDDSLAFTGA
jgi:hypothetical protein